MDGMSMSMSMSMADAPTSTMSGMSMASSTSTSMNMSGSTTMGMDSMAMTFFTSARTPLFSSTWTPASDGQYAGTCIFLIVLATLFRAILALRINFFEVVKTVRRRRGEDFLFADAADCKPRTRPWRANEAVMLSSLDVVVAGIGYLLMIAVMTMNVGYFLSVLGGVFLGSMVFDRFMAHSAPH